MSHDTLTPKQRRFVEEYLVDLNGTAAAIRAGYSPRTANEQASQLLAKLNVQEAVAAAQAERAARTEVTADRVIRELALLAFARAADLYESGPRGLRLRPLDELPPALAAAISEINLQRQANGRVNMRVRLHSKERALELLGRHLGLFNDKLQLSGGLSLHQFLDSLPPPDSSEEAA